MPREITYSWLDRPAELSAQEALFVSRLQANEDAAYDELVRSYSATIYHVAYRMLGDPADARMWSRRSSLRFSGTLKDLRARQR